MVSGIYLPLELRVDKYGWWGWGLAQYLLVVYQLRGMAAVPATQPAITRSLGLGYSGLSV